MTLRHSRNLLTFCGVVVTMSKREDSKLGDKP